MENIISKVVNLQFDSFIVMAWIGGFAAVHYLEQILTTGPIHVGFVSHIPFWGWYFLQCFFSLLGILKQVVGND